MLDPTRELMRQGVVTPAGPLTARERAAVSVALPPHEGIEAFVRGYDDDEPVLWVVTPSGIVVLSPERIGFEPATLPWWAIRDVEMVTHRWGAALVLCASRHVYRLDGVPTTGARDFVRHLDHLRTALAS